MIIFPHIFCIRYFHTVMMISASNLINDIRRLCLWSNTDFSDIHYCYLLLIRMLIPFMFFNTDGFQWTTAVFSSNSVRFLTVHFSFSLRDEGAGGRLCLYILCNARQRKEHTTMLWSGSGGIISKIASRILGIRYHFYKEKKLRAGRKSWRRQQITFNSCGARTLLISKP